MRLVNLFESMIHVPESLVNDMQEIIYAYVMCFMEAKGESINDVLTLLDYINKTPKHPELYKKIECNHKSKVVAILHLGLSSYNFKYKINPENLKLTVRLVDETGNYYGGYHDEHNVLDINIHVLKMLLANERVEPKYLEYILTEYENTIEHELMHYIQFNSFGKVDGKQIQKYDGEVKDVDDHIKYATSPVEFLPNLRSEFKTFKNKLAFLSNSIYMNKNDKMQVFRYFIGDKSARIDRFQEFLDDFRSVLLWKMRDTNKELWKKAINVMLQQYQKELDNENEE